MIYTLHYDIDAKDEAEASRRAMALFGFTTDLLTVHLTRHDDWSDHVNLERNLREPDDESRCPVCGEFGSYCQGHGQIGDPAGAALYDAHNNGDHSGCFVLADCRQ